MKYISQKVFDLIDSKLVKPSNTHQVDIFAALNHLTSHSNKNEKNYIDDIYIFSNFSNISKNFKENSNLVIQVIKFLNKKGIKLHFIGKNASMIQEKENVLTPFVTGSKAEILDFNQEIANLGKFTDMNYSQIPRYHGPLFFNNQFSMGVTCYPYIMPETKLYQLKPYSKTFWTKDRYHSDIKTYVKVTDIEGNEIDYKMIKKGLINF